MIKPKAINCNYSADRFWFCSFTKHDRTTYVVGIFFNDKAKATFDDIAKKLIINDMNVGNF